MAANTYRVRIVQGDRQFEVEGDKAFVLDMLGRFELPIASAPTKPGRARVKQGAPQMPRVEKALSVGEYVRQLGVKRHADLVVAFGYYLEHQGGIKEFTPADINNCYYEAKLEGSNTSQMLIHNIRRGYMMEAKRAKKGGKKVYTLTRSGEDYIKAKSAKQSESE